MNCKNHFFYRNKLIIDKLLRYAPSDDKLLTIPLVTNITEPFLSFCMQIAKKVPDRNNLLVGTNLLSFLQYVNQILSKLHAAGQFIVDNRSNPVSHGLSQQEIDCSLYTDSCVLHEYQYSLREFISMLKVIVDQFIMLAPTTSSDHIGGLLKSNDAFWDDNRSFLVGLNSAANYLKHHPYQFEEPSCMLHLNPPSLLVIVKNNDKDGGCRDLKRFFAHQVLDRSGEQHVSCLISCDFLVNGFNEFYKKFNKQMVVLNQN